MSGQSPDAFSLIGQAMLKICEHDMNRECDTPEMADALTLLNKARALLRPEHTAVWSGAETQVVMGSSGQGLGGLTR